ncbi:MAG: isoprenylcysteine carboxylmethyltransferase family protein [Anaerolineales bacterium]|nr:isoprenylcysteine carboxylmethyltransferase family protein [Anaerolineales bacterium]
MSLYSKWAKKKQTETGRILALIPAGVLFLYLLPLAITKGGTSIDRHFGLPALDFGTINHILGGILIVLGFSFALWSIYDQFSRASGTPLPMLPTQKLLVGGPFRYCRNPMTLGTVTAYLGIAVHAGTIITGIGIVLCFGTLLVLYLKLLEEKELAERFGEAYLIYKREVPFIIPRLPKRH